MTIQWRSELPDNRLAAVSSGNYIRMAIDASKNVHLAYVINENMLTYAIGKPQTFRQPGVGTGVIGFRYQWTFHDLMPWFFGMLFDLAVDSQGKAHLCFQGSGMQDHALAMNLSHGVLDPTNGQFVSTPTVVDSFIFLQGLAMTIAKDDSVHIAYSYSDGSSINHGIRYTTRAHNSSNPFQVVPVDARHDAILLDLSIAVGTGGNTGISYIRNFKDVNGLDIFQLMYAEKMPTGWLLDTADPGPMAFSNTFPPVFLGAGVFLQHGTNSLIIDANGVPHIAYFRDGSGIRHATWTAAGRGFWVGPFGFGEPVDQDGQPFPATILFDQSNALHIAYQAQSAAGTTELRFATHSAVSGWATGTVDPSPHCGWAISAAIDPNGLPHITYGFLPTLLAGVELKHTFAVDITLLQFPPHTVKRPILQRPG